METLEINGTEIPLLEPPHQENAAPRRILDMLFRRKGFISSVFLILFLAILIPILMSETKYVATSTVMIKPSRGYLNLSPATSQQMVSIHPSPETLNSEIQIIRSREVMERVVKELPFPNQNGVSVPIADNEAEIKRQGSWLRGRIKATPVRLSNLIQIRLESPHQEWAVKVVNKVAEYYLDQHLKVHQTQGVEEFYDEQERELQLELTQAEQALKDFQERENVVDVVQELSSTLTRLAGVETNLRGTESSIREVTERMGILEAQIKEQRENVQAGRTTPTNPVIARIRERLTQLELERDSLIQRYTKNNRLVMDKEKEIAELTDRLKVELKNVMGGDAVSLNSIHDGLLQSFLVARSEIKALEARKNTLTQQVAALSSQAAELRKKSYTADRLLQEVIAKKDALALYRRRGEEARISQAMDERRFGNVSVFENARLPIPRAGYDPFILGFIAFVVCLGIAVGLAFALEFFSTSVRNETDIEEEIGLPVLATIQNYRV